MEIIAEQNTINNSRCYTVDDVMRILGVGRKAVYSLIRQNVFRSIKVGSIGYRIPRESFEAWLNKC